MRKHTEEMEEYLRENVRYDPDTGHLWWTKSLNEQLEKGCLGKPLGSYSGGYLIFAVPRFVTKDEPRWFPLAHRVAWFLHYGVWPKGVLDHINGVTNDNRINNLREATRTQNVMNRRKRLSKLSQYKGVSYHQGGEKWRAYIHFNNKQLHLGHYTSEEEAARAYDKTAREYFGDYACLNFPDEHEQGATHGPDV